MIDGDTFDVDVNRNGRFTNPQERVRLLYVDTLELKKSHKGKDPKLGLPAKGFLKFETIFSVVIFCLVWFVCIFPAPYVF